jgi:GH24 family phage-related lysozyme (muramidase)
MADFSIASQIKPVQLPDQLQQYAQFNQLALHQAQLAEVQRAANEQNQMRALLGSGIDRSSPEAIRQAYNISMGAGKTLETSQSELRNAELTRRKTEGEIAAQGPALQKSRTEAMLEDAKHYRSQLNSALANPDDATAAAVYNSVLADVRRAHPEIATKWPERFDRATITSLMQTPEQTVQAQAAARLAAQPQMGVGPGNIPVFGNRAAGTFVVGQDVTNAPLAAGAPFAPPAGTPTAVMRQPAVPVVARPAGAAPAAGAGAAPAAAPADLASNLLSNLLRRFEGFRETPYYDVNAYRTGYGSDTITQADGKVIKVQPGMQITKEDAERDLSRRLNTEFIPKATMQVGAENWTALPAPAQAALASVAYNYGSLPSSVVAAVKTGDVNAIADAVQSLKDNPGRRAQEAAVIRGNGLIQSSPTVPSMTMGQQFAVPGSVPGGMNALAPLAGIPAGGFNNLATPAPPQLAAPAAMPVAGAPAVSPRMDFAAMQERAVQQAGALKGAEKSAELTATQQAEKAQRKESASRLLGTVGGTAASDIEKLIQASTSGRLAADLADRLEAVTGKSTKGMTNIDALAVIASSITFDIANGKYGSGFTDKDREAVETMSGRIADREKDPARRIAAFKQFINYMKAASEGKELEVLPPAGSAAPKSAGFTEGQTATGPNGAKLIFRNGDWVAR